MRTLGENNHTALRAGKCGRPSRDWFFVLNLIGQEGGTNSLDQLQSENKTNVIALYIYFLLVNRPRRCKL